MRAIVGATEYDPFVLYFPLKHWNVVLSIKYHVHICQVSPQHSCGDTWQIWMWLRLFISYFYNIRSMTSRGIKIRTFSNPIAIAIFPTKLRYLQYSGILRTLLTNSRYNSHSIIWRLQHITFQVINTSSSDHETWHTILFGLFWGPRLTICITSTTTTKTSHMIGTKT